MKFAPIVYSCILSCLFLILFCSTTVDAAGYLAAPSAPAVGSGTAPDQTWQEFVEEMADKRPLSVELLESWIEMANAQKYLMAGVSLATGVLLCFAGFMYFRIMLFIIGLIGSFGCAVFLMEHDPVSTLLAAAPNSSKWIAAIIIALAGASLITVFFNFGVYAVAAIGGFQLGCTLTAIPQVATALYDFAGKNGSLGFCILMAIAAIILAHYVRKIAVIIASSVAGSGLMILAFKTFSTTFEDQSNTKQFIQNLARAGLLFVECIKDCFIDENEKALLLEQKSYLIYLASFVAIAVAGVVVQLLAHKSK